LAIGTSSQGVNALDISIEEMWALTSRDQIRAEARRRGDRLRRQEAALPGRGDAPDGEILLHLLRTMDRHRVDSAAAAQIILNEWTKNRHHPHEIAFLRETIMHPVPAHLWLFEEARCG